MQELKFISTVYLFSSYTLLRSSKFGLSTDCRDQYFPLRKNHAQVSIQVRTFLIASLRMLTASIVIAIPMDSTKLFQNAMESGKHSDKNYKYQEDEKNYYNSDE